MARIKKIEDAMPKLKKQYEDFMLWYKAQTNAFDRQIAYERLALQNQLEVTGEKLIRTDMGTVSLSHPTEKTWPTPEELVAWCEKNQVPDSIKTVKTPVMKVVSKYIKETGAVPPGYTEEKTTSITIRPPSAKVTQEQMSDAA